MDAGLKKVLLNIVYYSLIAVMVAFVIFLFVTLQGATMAMWEMVMFYVIVAALVGVVIYDIICTCMHRQKYIAGLILYVITMVLIVFTLIVMAINSANGRLLIDITERFFRIILFSYIINVFAVLIYCTGEKLIVNNTNRMKK